MENEEESTNENLSEHTVDQKSTTGIEHHTLVESVISISTIKATSENEKSSTTNKINSFQEETAKENNRTLRRASASESFSKAGSDIGSRDKLLRVSREDALAKIISVDQLDKTHERRSLRNETLSDGSKREIKSTERMDDVTMIGRRRRQPFRDIIGKREQRRDELEKMEGDLRQRLDMLECSVPAAMVWNIWRKAQGAPVCKIKRILERQFKEVTANEITCRSTPSRHYDSRVRQVEVERKLALKRMEEARDLWTEKVATLEEKKKKLEEAKRIQEEQKNTMVRLNEEARELREAMEKEEIDDESCQYGECGDTQCKQRWLGKVSTSVTSIESGDIECLEKLQRLAEDEIIMKKEIADLECREEAYMRTLQQADELWSKLEGDTVSETKTLQERLQLKTAANQQLADRVCELEDALEKCRTRMAACKAELEKFLSIEKVEAVIGRDDDIALVADKKVAVKPKVVHRPVGRVDDVAMVRDDEVLAKIEVADEEVSARIALVDADTEVTVVRDDKVVWIKPDSAELAVDRQVDLMQIVDAESVVRPEDFVYEQQKFKEVREYLAKLSSLEELYRDDGEACAPDFVCNDEVFSPTGMTDEELIALGVEPAELTKKVDRKLVVSEEEQDRQFQVKLTKEADDVTDYIEEMNKKADRIRDVETERKVVEKVEERIAEVVDLPVSETAARRAIPEKPADDTLVTMPDDVREPKVKKIEVDQGIVIQRDKIQSWMDTIDTIRTTIAKHQNCDIVKQDADVLAEMIGAYIGVTPKEVTKEQETIKNEQRKVNKTEKETDIYQAELDKEEIKFMPQIPTELLKTEPVTKIQVEPAISPEITTETIKVHNSRAEELKTDEQEVIIETKLENKLMDLEKKNTNTETKARSIPIPYSEEAPTEVKAPIESIDESQLLPDLTKEEISADIEQYKPVSMENSFQAPTIPVKKDLNNGIVPLTEQRVTVNAEIERIGIEEETRIKGIVTEEAEIFQVEKIEANSALENLTERKLMEVTSNEVINSIRNEKPSNAQKIEKKENKIIPEHVERVEMKVKDVPREAVLKEENALAEKIEANEVSPMTEISEIKVTEDEVEKLEQIPQLDKTKTKIEETTPKIIETGENAKTLPVTETKEIEQTDVEKTVPTMKEMEELVVDKISPIADSIEIKRLEPSKLPVVDVAKVPTEKDVIEEKIRVEETRPDVKEEEVKVEKLPVPDEVIEEKVEIKKPAPTDVVQEKIQVAELPSIDTEIVEEDKEAEIKEPSPIADTVIEKKIEVEEPSLIVDSVTEEKIEIKEPPAITDTTIIEEKVEMVQPITEPPLIMEEEAEEVEAIEQPVLEEIAKEKDEEIEEISAKPPPSEPPVERKEEELPAIDKEEILAEIAMPIELMVPTVEEKETLLKEEKPETIEIEKKVPPVEMKPIEAATIPIEPRLAVQPYIVVAKIEEREMLHIITTTQPSCAGCRPVICHMPSPADTREHVEIRRTDVVQQTEVAQVITQAVSTVESRDTPPVRIISEYLKPPEPKASAEIAGDRPEITGRKMLWRKRLKDQSTVTTASAGSQTDKTSRVSHDRVARERTRVPTDELLRSIKIAAAGLTRGNIEREIRTINYGRRHYDTKDAACNCCLCGETTTSISSTSMKSKLTVRPQTDVEAATPTTAALKRMIIPIKIDPTKLTPRHDGLCSDCRAKIQDKISREKGLLEYTVKKITRDQSCTCATTGKSCRTAPRKQTIEKKDQCCLAKIPKRKNDSVNRKKKRDSPTVSVDTKKTDIKPLSSSCICFKLEKTGVGPMRKGNCYCAD